MGDDVEEIPLPNGPANLCFNKNEFVQDDFNVYQFVSQCRKQVPLEKVRDDLNLYLTILRNAMIELINKDYADFVNLSTNLVGLDRMFNNLVIPIGQLKEEIQLVKLSLDNVVDKAKQKLERRQLLREKKICLQHLMNISMCVNKIEKLLRIEHEPEQEPQCFTSDKELNGGLMERVAVEFNQLHFHVTKSKGHAFVEEMKPRIVFITRILQKNLEIMFLIGVKENDIEKLRQCLRIYATIDRMKEVENLFRQQIVKPFMDEVVQADKMSDQSGGVQLIYKQILAFIPKHCDQLRKASAGNQTNLEAISGYDFLVNSIWPEFVSAAEIRLNSLFAPANAKKFHERYVATLQFLEQFEMLCGSQDSVKRLREHQSYVTFMNKWNLPVYFQIKFQDIAGNLEQALTTPWEITKDGESSEFSLNVTHVLWQNLLICWSKDVYLCQLCHRFWKLSLQLVSRFCEWIRTVIAKELVLPTESSDSSINQEVKQPVVSLRSTVLLVSDINVLTLKLTSYCEDVVQPQLMDLGFKDTKILKESIQEFQDFLNLQISPCAQYITESISRQCGNQLKLINDIPRLYRRTNREAPTKSSSYVGNVLTPLETFLEEQKTILTPEIKSEWGLITLGKVSKQFYDITFNLLLSVKKMEESLSRLKKAREKGTATTTGSITGISDDDKIRLQLSLDVQHFGTIIVDMGFEKNLVENYESLVEMIESARTSPNK